MKKAFALIIAILLFTFALPINAAESQSRQPTLDDLWEERAKEDANEYTTPQRDSQENVYIPVFRHPSDALGLLLYTRAANKWTVKKCYIVDDDNQRFDKEYYFYDISPSVETIDENGSNAIAVMYIPELLPTLEKCYTGNVPRDANENLYKILPCLRSAVKEYNLTKNELIEACKKSRENPEIVKKYFSDFSEEEFERMKSKGELTFDLDQSWLLDALYAERDLDCSLLCIKPFATIVGNTLVRQSDLFREDYTPETLLASAPGKMEIRSFKALLHNAKNYVSISDDYDNINRETTLELLHHFDEVINAYTPATGDHTALYMIVSGSAALSLLAFAICLHSKKNRYNV